MNSDVLFIPTKRRSVLMGAVHARNGGRKRIRVLIGSWISGGVPKTERTGRNPYHLRLKRIDVPTGGATGGGTVNLSALGLITTGTINTTPTGTGKGGGISVSGGGVLVNADLRTGAGGDAITLNTSGIAITRGGAAQS